MLTSSLLILPSVTALQIARSFKNTMVVSSICGIVSVIIGIYASFVMNLPTGATIVMVNFLLFLTAYAYKNAVQRKYH
jgi:zinc transport system permease protein